MKPKAEALGLQDSFGTSALLPAKSSSREELAELLSDPLAFEALVDALPDAPEVRLLKIWGCAYGVYPLASLQTTSEPPTDSR